MRIMAVIASLGAGGAETLARNLAKEFSGAGHACHIVYISDTASLGGSPAFERDSIDDLAAAGISVEQLGHECRRNIAKGATRLRGSIRRFAPDVVHVHVAYGLLFRSLAFVRVPTVYTHHSTRMTFPAILLRWFDRSVTRYVAVCGAGAALLRRHVKRPVTTIANGIAEGFSRAGPRSGMPRDPEVLSVGTLRELKGYRFLIEAAAMAVPRFAAQGRRIRFTIAGEGVERPALERLIEQKGLQADVELAGARTDISAMMDASDLLVQSSLTEGLPITLIEAAAAGLPTIATDVGGCAEIVEDGVNGYLIPPARPDLLAERIEKIFADEDLYTGFSRAAKQVSARFRIDRCAAEHVQLYADAIAAEARR